MVSTVLTSRLLRILASRTRLAMALGALVAAAAIAAPAAAGTASAATGEAPTGAVAAGPSGPAPAAVDGLACRTLTNCMAIGANAPQMAPAMVAERWNGSQWARTAIPKPAGADEVAPDGIACPGNQECVAVGVGDPAGGSGFFALAGYWNGARWTAARAAAPGSGSLLTAVSCPSSTNCYAVGNYTQKGSSAVDALIEYWNGRHWSQQTAPDPRGTTFNELIDVSCPSAKFCVAVGTDGAGVLIERWNGHTWSAATPKASSSAVLNGVSCPSATSCFAVGSNFTSSGGSLVERWNGSSWSGSATPVPRGAVYSGLRSVSCVSATRCLAVGNDFNPAAYAVSWSGGGWHLVGMSTTGGRIGGFIAVTCLAAASCAALGATTQFAASARSESAFWNGTRWKVVLTT
jgi:hypothetical protein